MKINLPAAALAAFLVIAAGCAKMEIEKKGLVKLPAGVYAFIAEGPSSPEGLGANSGFVVGNDGVLVVDSRQSPLLAGELLDAIRSVTEAPILYLVNTHYHPDHTWGNSVFRDEGAVIIARPETAINLERYSPIYMEYYRQQKPEIYRNFEGVEVVLPDSILGDRMRIDLGGVEVLLEHFGPGHTAGDCVVSVPEAKTVFTGGLVSNGYNPNMGDEGADFKNWLQILDKIEKMNPRYIVPCQGYVCGKDVLKRQKDYITEMISYGRKAIADGVPLADAALNVKMPGFEDYLQKNLLAFNVRAVYRKEVLDVVKPGFSIRLPEYFIASDGGGGGRMGRILWGGQNDDGYMEIEIEWQPSGQGEVILQDIYDRVARFAGGGGDLEMQIDGSKSIVVGGREEPACYGRWAVRSASPTAGGGVWTWTMTLRDGILYVMKLKANSGNDREKETRCMAILEKIPASFKTTGP